MHHSFNRRRVLQLAGGAVATALAGCLEGRDDPDSDRSADADGSSELGEPATHVDVTAVSVPTIAFDPGIVHVVPGDTVRWIVEGYRHDDSWPARPHSGSPVPAQR